MGGGASVRNRSHPNDKYSARKRPGSCVWRLLALAPWPADAAEPLKIGVLTDMSGPIADMVGPGSVTAVKLAVEDFGGSVLGRQIEVVSADHQNKGDVAAAIARRWFDNEHVEAIADLTVSVTAGIVQDIAGRSNKIALISGSGTLDLFGKNCTPTGFVWTFDTEVPPQTVSGVTRRLGPKSWFFIAPDYSFGKQMVAAANEAIKRDGGRMVGSVGTPVGTPDFAGPLLSAQSSGADIVAFSLGGHDFLNATKQAVEFNLPQKQQLATIFTTITDVNAIGLEFLKAWCSPRRSTGTSMRTPAISAIASLSE